MKFVFAPSVICLAFFLLENCSGLPAIFKRLSSGTLGSQHDSFPSLSRRDNRGLHPVLVARSLMGVAPEGNHQAKAIEYTMPHDNDLSKSDVEVYNGKNVVYRITKQDKPGPFKITDSYGKTVLEVKPDSTLLCNSGQTYLSADEKVTFTIRNSLWTVSFVAGQTFVLDPVPKGHASTYERNLTLRGTVDTTVSTNLSGSETVLPLQSVDTIHKLTTSICPVEYVISLLVIEHQSKSMNLVKRRC